MSGFEALDIHKFVKGLENDTLLKAMFPDGNVIISADYTPREPPPFYIVFSQINADDKNGMGGVRVFVDSMYHISTVGRDVGFDVLRPIAERIDAFLSSPDTPRQIGSTYIGRFIRQGSDATSVWLNNINWHYIDGMYKTIAYTYT